MPVGPLTITGTSDSSATECQVYSDWNDKKPFGKAVATGPGGPDDYSKWTFTYSDAYHLIKNGTNNLTSKISCVDGPTSLTKWYSVNVTGVNGLPSPEGVTQPSSITQAQTADPHADGFVIPLSTLNSADITSPPLDPVIGEEEDEGEDNSDSDSNDEDDDDDGDNDNSGDDVSQQDGDVGNNGDEDNDHDNDGDGLFGSDGPVNFGPDGPVD